MLAIVLGLGHKRAMETVKGLLLVPLALVVIYGLGELLHGVVGLFE